MSDLASLKSQRLDIASRLADVASASARLREAEHAEAALLAKISALGEAEVAAMREWARGAKGDAPKIDVAERTRLAGELAQAQLQAEAARGAAVDLANEQRRLSGELLDVNDRIAAEAFDALADRHQRELDNFASFLNEHVRPKLGRLLGLHAFIVGRAQHHQAAGRIDAANALFRRAEAIGARMPAFDVMPSPGEVTAKVPAWAERFEALTSDAANVVLLETGAAA